MVHTASPVVGDAANEENTVKPALAGTQAILDGCLKFGVKRLCITSSVAAIVMGDDPYKTEYTAEDWSTEAGWDAYAKSKALSEKLCFDFSKKNPSLEVCSVHPGVTIGPNLNTASWEVGDGMKAFLLGGGMHVNVPMPTGDVRDVREAHLQAILRPEAAGKRFVAAKEPVTTHYLAEVAYKKYGNNGYGDINRTMTGDGTLKCMLCCFACPCSYTYKKTAHLLGKGCTIDNSQTRQILGVRFERTIE